jgi:hypothetical protein
MLIIYLKYTPPKKDDNKKFSPPLKKNLTSIGLYMGVWRTFPNRIAFFACAEKLGGACKAEPLNSC